MAMNVNIYPSTITERERERERERESRRLLHATICLQEKLEKYAQQKAKFEVFQDICGCTLDIILKCAFSYDVDVQRQG